MLLKFKCFALLLRFVQSPLKPGDTKHAVIALRAGDSVRLCEHVQRSFAKTLPFDRLGTDGRAKGKIGERGRERGNGRTNHTWASRGGISCSRFSNLVMDETQTKRCFLETSMNHLF